MWEHGTRVKFHYTEHEHAVRILAEQVFRVPERPGSAGHGLYVTTVQPRSLSDEKLLDLLFARGRPVIAIEGVVCCATMPLRGRATRIGAISTAPLPGRFWTCRSHWLGAAYVVAATGSGRMASICRLHESLLIFHAEVR